jgi:hypothetical protein
MNPNEPNYGQLPATPQQAPVPSPQPDVQQSSPTTPAAPVSTNPYDFILNPNANQKKPAAANASGPMRLLLGIGLIGGILLIVGLALTQFLPKGTSGESLVGLIQQQQEIIRVSTQAQQTAQSETIKGFAYTVNLSVSTSQQQLQGYATKAGTKIDPKQLSLKQDATTDKLLENAKATSTYDSAVKKVLSTLLQDYLDQLKETYKQTSSANLKKILDANFNAGKTLIIQADNVSA